MPVAGSGTAVEAKNGIRASIKSLFPDRDCATLVRPMHEEAVSKHCAAPCSVVITAAPLTASTGAGSAALASCCAGFSNHSFPASSVDWWQWQSAMCLLFACAQALVSLDQIPVEQLRPEFRQGVAALLQVIFAKVQSQASAILERTVFRRLACTSRRCKSRACSPPVLAAAPGISLLCASQSCCRVSLLLSFVQAQPRSYGTLGVMSGPLLAGLTGAYVSAINAGAVPTIATAWQVRGSQHVRVLSPQLDSSM
jgi:hypothetical protein